MSIAVSIAVSTFLSIVACHILAIFWPYFGGFLYICMVRIREVIIYKLYKSV